MLIINLYRYLTGYVEILVSGEFCEKILNLFAANRINVWDIESDKNSIRLKISIRDFKNLRTIKGKTHFKIKILKKFGLVFLTRRYIWRLGIPVGVFLFFITLNILAMFVWNIIVVGNESVPTNAILTACENIGIKNGVMTKNIDSQLLREKLLLECKGLSWCSFNVEGSRVTVNVSEIKNSTDKDVPCNIVSDYNCIISEILVESGVPAVQKGQAVKKGDLLVSGVSDISGVNKFIHAKANIKADITESVEVSSVFSQEKRRLTGKVVNKSVLEFFGIKIPLYLGSTAGEFDEQVSVENIYLFGEKMPIKIYNKSFHICETYEYLYTRSELLEELTKQMDEKIRKISGECEILERNISENEQGITLKYEIRYNKYIGSEENLIFDVSN